MILCVIEIAYILVHCVNFPELHSIRTHGGHIAVSRNKSRSILSLVGLVSSWKHINVVPVRV